MTILPGDFVLPQVSSSLRVVFNDSYPYYTLTLGPHQCASANPYKGLRLIPAHIVASLQQT